MMHPQLATGERPVPCVALRRHHDASRDTECDNSCFSTIGRDGAMMKPAAAVAVETTW
jgi:hypothetical protein